MAAPSPPGRISRLPKKSLLSFPRMPKLGDMKIKMHNRYIPNQPIEGWLTESIRRQLDQNIYLLIAKTD